MWCSLQFKSIYSYVFGSKELHMKHVIYGKTLYQRIIVF